MQEESLIVEGCEEELVVHDRQSSLALTSSLIVKQDLINRGKQLAKDEKCGFTVTSSLTGHNT